MTTRKTRARKTRARKAKRQPATFTITLDGDHLDALDALAAAHPPAFPPGMPRTRTARIRFCVRNFASCLDRLRAAQAAQTENVGRLDDLARIAAGLKALIEDSDATKPTLAPESDRFE